MLTDPCAAAQIKSCPRPFRRKRLVKHHRHEASEYRSLSPGWRERILQPSKMLSADMMPGLMMSIPVASPTSEARREALRNRERAIREQSAEETQQMRKATTTTPKTLPKPGQQNKRHSIKEPVAILEALRNRERAIREHSAEETQQMRKANNTTPKTLPKPGQQNKRHSIKDVLCSWHPHGGGGKAAAPSLNCVNVVNDIYREWDGNDIATVAGLSIRASIHAAARIISDR